MRPAIPELDHLVVGCLSLPEGRAELEARLGAPAQGGGAHLGAGTHNALWGLDGGARWGMVYLELIAPDPAQRLPHTGRLPFGLHLPEVRARFGRGPRLLTWMARCRGLEGWVTRSLAPLGPIQSMRRGDLSWRLTAPADGRPVLDGIVPGLIDWPVGRPTPAETLAGSGLRLTGFAHRPDRWADRLLASLGMPAVCPPGDTGGAPLRAEIEGPAGAVTLD